MKAINVSNSILCEARIKGQLYRLFDYVEVEVKVELKGFHKVMTVTIVS